MYRGKVFCVGRNKTGTTSLSQALMEFGYRLGNQRQGELLLEQWANREFRQVIELCRTADAFQDIPFSLPFTYQAVDAAFPGSKFILTVRSTAQEWFESVVRFHSRIVGKSSPPSADELRAFDYVYPGWLWKNQRLIYSVPDSHLYDPGIYIQHYQMHNLSVRDYFRFRQNQLLVLDLAQADSMRRLCEFLDIAETGRAMPHLNRSDG